ncbi:Regulator of sigma D [gamma proteobacterium HdN1]|nr:Regulator of sigma D [gamma proteobacterium HdN1]
MLKYTDNLKYDFHPELHWQSVDQLVNKWLKSRQELILLFCAVDSLRDFAPKSTPAAVKVKAFCQSMIDYISAGHFKIYDELIDEISELEDDADDLITGILPQIQTSTEIAIEFNDRYADANIKEITPQIARHLSLLGEKLAERFELEDRLVEILHSRQHALAA